MRIKSNKIIDAIGTQPKIIGHVPALEPTSLETALEKITVTLLTAAFILNIL